LYVTTSVKVEESQQISIMVET